MPSSAVHIFGDPDEYAQAIRASQVELQLAARGDFAAKLTRIDLHQLWMQRFSERLPRIAHASDAAGRVHISFRMPGPAVLLNGAEIRPSEIVRHSEAEASFQRSYGPTVWASMSLPVDAMVSFGAAAGSDLTAPHETQIVHPPTSVLAALQRLHAAAAELAEQAPELISNAEVARGLEQELVQAVVECITPVCATGDRSAERRHAAVMKRFWAELSAHSDHIFYLPELCRAIGVSIQTLRVCCREQLGVSPLKYLILRRLHMAHRALAAADAKTTTVTEIATAHGFWELGRFAVSYRSLFGERPSVTLQRPSDALRVGPVGIGDLKFRHFA